MPGILVMAALVVLAAADGAPPQPQAESPSRQWLCWAQAKGSQGSSVSVAIYVQTDGTVVVRDTRWSPPKTGQWPRNQRSEGSSGTPFTIEPFSIDLTYGKAGNAGPGAADGLSSVVESTSDLKSLEGTTASLELDGGRPWPLEFLKMIHPAPGRRIVGISDFQEWPLDKKMLNRAEEAQQAVIRLRSPDGKPLAWARYDLSAHQERDRLFRQAWKEASTAALHPTGCQKTEASDHPLPVGIRVRPQPVY